MWENVQQRSECYKLMYEAIVRRVLEEMKISTDEVMDDHQSFEEVRSGQNFVKKYIDFINFREALEKGEPLQKFQHIHDKNFQDYPEW